MTKTLRKLCRARRIRLRVRIPEQEYLQCLRELGKKVRERLRNIRGARCSSVVRAFAHGAMGRWIDPSWGGPIELFLVSASAPRLAF